MLGLRRGKIYWGDTEFASGCYGFRHWLLEETDHDFAVLSAQGDGPAAITSFEKKDYRWEDLKLD